MTITIAPQGWGVGNTVDIYHVLLSVYQVFVPCFQDKLNTRDLLVVHSDDYPVSYRHHNTILLTAHDCYWCNYAYQFAHELCHLQIPSKVPQQLRWFEESLCELASYYFLPRISDLWKTDPPHHSWITYADAFTAYVKNDQKKIEPFNLDLREDLTVSEQLARNEYDRGKNAYVALNLLPIFDSCPDLWTTIHLLSSIPADLSIAESLRYWHSQSPMEYQNSIEKILRVFLLEP